MPQPRRIDSARNPLVKELAALKTRPARDRSGLTLVEGLREARRAVAAGLPVTHLLLCPGMTDATAALEALRRAVDTQGAETVELSPEAFGRVSMRQHPDGVALVARSPARDLTALALPPVPLVLVLDGLEKPGNVGALLRSADAAGADAIVLSGKGTDLGNPNVVRASMGSVFALPVAVAGTEAALRWLRERGLRLVVATPHAAKAHWDADYRAGTALVLGAEHAGVAPAWLDAADERVRIPMRSRAADSLNVAVAGAVILFEATRQRRP